MYAEDKENIRPIGFENKKYDSKSDRAAAPKKGGMFSSMLDSACKETRQDMDEKFAYRTQCEDITNLVEKICDDFDREEQGNFALIFSCWLILHRSQTCTRHAKVRAAHGEGTS